MISQVILTNYVLDGLHESGLGMKSYPCWKSYLLVMVGPESRQLGTAASGIFSRDMDDSSSGIGHHTRANDSTSSAHTVQHRELSLGVLITTRAFSLALANDKEVSPAAL